MSCEDDQAECHELFVEIRDKNVLTKSEVQELSELFVDFSEAHDADLDAADVLDDIGCTLKQHVAKYNLNDVTVGWFVETR